MKNRFDKCGSDWAKWDLHVHTPLSIIQSYGGAAAFRKREKKLLNKSHH